MNQQYLQLYADFIVKVGVNVRPRQNFIVRCPVTMGSWGAFFSAYGRRIRTGQRCSIDSSRPSSSTQMVSVTVNVTGFTLH